MLTTNSRPYGCRADVFSVRCTGRRRRRRRRPRDDSDHQTRSRGDHCRHSSLPRRSRQRHPRRATRERYSGTLSPLRGLNLDFSRNPSAGRPVDLLTAICSTPTSRQNSAGIVQSLAVQWLKTQPMTMLFLSVVTIRPAGAPAGSPFPFRVSPDPGAWKRARRREIGFTISIFLLV